MDDLDVHHDPERRMFTIGAGPAAKMTYSRAGDTTITIDHTEVADALRGKGAGRRLVEAAVEWARRDHLVIIPLCPFAKATFDKVPSLRDVVAAR